MSAAFLFPVLMVCIAATVIFPLTEAPGWCAPVCGGVALGVAVLLWRVVMVPRRLVRVGMELLSGQDCNSRLRTVGQPDADRIVTLFNRLMGSLGEERRHIREQENLLSLLIDASPMGVAMLDDRGCVTRVNAAFCTLLGVRDEADIAGRGLSGLPGRIGEALAGLPDGGECVVRPGGNAVIRCYRRWFMQMGCRRPFLLVESLTEEVMRIEREAYGRVIRLIAHEVNNSMAGFRGLLSQLEDIFDGDPDMEAVISSVTERCVALGSFIGGYADVVRLPEPKFECIDVSEFVESQLPFLESVAGMPLDFRCDESARGARVSGDPVQLGQVMVNLVRNARQSLESLPSAGVALGPGEAGEPEAGSDIAIELTSDISGITLAVSDRGPGIAPDQRERLFTPFYSTRPGGQGIGLTLVSEILRRHGCHYVLATEADGCTRFRIRWTRL